MNHNDKDKCFNREIKIYKNVINGLQSQDYFKNDVTADNTEKDY